MVVFRGLYEEAPQTVPQTTPQTAPQLDDIDSGIIKAIKLNSSILQRKIAMVVGVSYDTVRYHMENMRKQKIIARNGSGRTGKWIIL